MQTIGRKDISGAGVVAKPAKEEKGGDKRINVKGGKVSLH